MNNENQTGQSLQNRKNLFSHPVIRKGSLFQRALQATGIALIWLVIWQLVYWLIGHDLLLSSPGQVLVRLFSLIQYPDFWWTTLSSLGRIAAGFGLGTAGGIILAVLTASSRWLEALFKPIIGTIRATPVASFIILALIWMSQTRVVVFIVFLMVLPVIWANVFEGISRTNHDLIEMGKVFKLSPVMRFNYIYVPSVMPYFSSAVTTGLGLGWKAGIAAEVLSTPAYSLGKNLYEAKIYLETADVFAYTAVVIILSLALEALVNRMIRYGSFWVSRYGGQSMKPSHRILRPIIRKHTHHHSQGAQERNQGAKEHEHKH